MNKPFAWYGGKGVVAPFLTLLLPPHQVSCEVFGVSGALLFAKAAKRPTRLPPLTCIHQTGITREWDGTTTSPSVLSVSRDQASVVFTLTVSPDCLLFAQALFDARMSASLKEVEAQ
jgi:hypothetical protein